MGILRIIARNDALSFIEKTTERYFHEMGVKAVKHLVDGLWVFYSSNI